MISQREEKEAIIRGFGRDSKDTGSSEVQVALLTKDIEQLTEHCKTHEKDFSSKRGLTNKVFQRKRLLSYLECTDHAKYKQLVDKLGLRK